MSERTFLVTFDRLDPTADVGGLKEFIKTNKMFGNWWNHIPGVFLVTSNSDSDAISAEVRHYTKDARLLVIEVQPGESDGLLSDSAWKWIRRREEQVPGMAAASEG
jgi:hypothetical protein